MSKKRIAVIPGDGIGKEVMPEGVRVMDAAARKFGIDLVHDQSDADAGRKLAQPLRVLWGEHGVVGRCFDVLALWRDRALDVSGGPLPCGHYIPEEAPRELLAEALPFFSEPTHQGQTP